MKKHLLFLIILPAFLSFSLAATDISGGDDTGKPIVDIKADNIDGPITIPKGEEVSISWTVRASLPAGSKACAASSSKGDFKGNKLAVGSENFIITDGPRIYTIDCSLPGGKNAKDTVVVNVSSDDVIWFQNVYRAAGWLTWSLNNFLETSEFSQGARDMISLTREVGASFEFSRNHSYADYLLSTFLDDVLIDQKTIRLSKSFAGPFYDIVDIPVYDLSPGKHRVSSQLRIPLTRHEKRMAEKTGNYNLYKGRIFSISEFEILPAEIQKPEVDLRINGADSVEIPSGSSATLTWTSSGVDFCTSQADGKNLKIDLPLQEISGKETAPVGANHTFTIVCVNSITEQQASDSIKIKAIK